LVLYFSMGSLLGVTRCGSTTSSWNTRNVGIRQYWFRLTLCAHLLQAMICNSVLGEGGGGSTSTHECTSWPSCPRDGLQFFHPASISQLLLVSDIWGFFGTEFFYSTLASILPSHLVKITMILFSVFLYLLT
jgi:hypothetical protein